MTKALHPDMKKGKVSKLTVELVRHLRQMDAEGLLNVRAAAQAHGVAAETIRRMLRGETWNDLTMNPPRTDAELDVEATASLARIQAAIAAQKAVPVKVEGMLNELVEEPAGEVVLVNRNLAKERGYL